jgi:hypothetical protein
MDFIDKKLELEMGWAVNQIRGRSSSGRQKSMIGKGKMLHSNSST